jgi:hypothetical protein
MRQGKKNICVLAGFEHFNAVGPRCLKWDRTNRARHHWLSARVTNAFP